MQTADYTILIVMGVSAIIAAGAFSVIAGYLFDRGLADRHAKMPDIRFFYTTYMARTRRETGRVGTAFWIHCVSAGIFILAGVIYTIARLILPRFF